MANTEPERCAVCGAQYDPVLDECPICGAERALAPKGHASSLMTLALGLLALAMVVGLGARLRPWQNAELDPDRLVLAVVDRLGPARAPAPTTLPPTSMPTPTAEPTPTATMSPTTTPSPTTTLEPPTIAPEDLESTIEPDDAAAEAGPPPEAEPVIHEVVAGDTLLAIAKQYGVDSADIASANGISENSVLRIGQRLEIPMPRGGPISATTAATASVAERTPLPSPTPTQRPEVLRHTVAKGETLSQIAVQYQVSSAEIAAANGFAVGAVLSIGQELLIPGLTPDATPTPEPSPTPTGAPTVAPTIEARAKAAAAAALAPAYNWKYMQPQPLAPLDGAVFSGADDVPLLSWASVGILSDDEWYRLRVWPTSGVVEATVVWTKNTSWRTDAILCTGEQRELNWQVLVATRTETDEAGVAVSIALSEPSIKQSFMWR
jgi:LysM repeat protein